MKLKVLKWNKWNVYTVLEENLKTSARCKDCNAEVSAKV